MKNIILIISLIVLGLNAGYTQNYNWITPGQTYLKMFIAEDGMYRIDKSDFTIAGINTTGIDPRTVKVYYKGSQIRIYFQGEQDGVFDENDFFDFYGQRNYGGLTNTYDVNGNLAYITDEYYNIYSDTSTYFVGWGGSYGTRYINSNNQVSTPYPLNYFKAKVHFETEALYWLGESTSGQDYRYFLNDKFQGEGWYWRAMANNNTQSNTVNLPYCVPNADMFEFKIFAYPTTNSSAVFNEHRMMVRINNNLVDTIKRDDFNRMDTTYSFPGTYFVTGNNTVLLKFTPPSTFTSARMYLDMFSITYPRRFAFDSNKISIYNLNSDTATKLFSISGFVPANELTIYDYVNGYRITNFSNVNDILNFSGKSNGKYEITNKPITKKPKRIKQRQVPNLVTNSTGVDYLVVYNKLFESQAEQLRQYRASHDNYRTFKAEIEDIYDIFNYGIEDPVALRRFSKQVYQFWQAPKIKYLTLFGRGSLDPKKILSSSTYYNNYVPVYGNPTTDGYFVNYNENTTTYFHQIAVGRLPAFSITEAQTIVNKIIQYESLPLDYWTKNAGMFTGGYLRADQLNNLNQSEYYVNNYISSRPLSLKSNKIYIDDTSGFINFNYFDSVINVINNGCLLTNYVGHAGNGYWDFTFEDPLVLNNQYKLPLVLSMTCFTGKNAEANSRGYGERFMHNQNGGSIGFISTSGWSWSSSGNIFNEWCIKGMSSDTLRIQGNIVKHASQKMASDSVSFPVRNTINCNSLLGDPALKILLPKSPEFTFLGNDYILENQFPVLYDKVDVKIIPKNFGIFSDSCKIRIQKYFSDNLTETKEIVLRNFGFVDTLYYRFQIDSIGSYKIKVNLDADNWVPNENKTNNQLEIKISTKNYAFIPLKPIDNQTVKNDTVEIVGLNPQLKSNQTVKFLVQLDTAINFNSPVNSSYFTTSYQYPFTKFRIKIPILDTNILYFWRLNLVVNNDTIGWSKISSFKYYSLIQNPDTVVRVKKTRNYQFLNDDKQKVFVDSNIRIGKFIGNIIACSYGGSPWDNSYIIANNKYFYLMGDPYVSGLYMLKISKNNGNIIKTNHTFFSSAQSSDSALNFLNSFDTTHILAAVKLMPIYATNEMSTDLKNRFKSFGSYYIDSFSIRSWYHWSFISYSALPNVIKSENYKTNWGPTISQMNPEFQSADGNIQMKFGPADNWKNFSWQQTLFPKTSIAYNVVGISKNNQEILLAQNITNNNFVGIDTINPQMFPYIKLISNLTIDTSEIQSGDVIPYGGIPSPIMKSVQINYCPPPELAMDYTSTIKSDSIINENDSIGISYKFYNIGYKNCYGSVSRIFLNRGSEKVYIYQDTNFSTIKVDSSLFVKKYVNLSGFIPSYRKSNENIALNIEVLPLWQNEFHTYNNIVTADVVVRSNFQSITLDLFADGIKILGGEYVKRNPEISVKYTGKDVLPVNFADTSLFRILINNKLYQFNAPVTKPVTQSDVVDKKVTRGEQNDAKRKQYESSNSFVIYPELQEGENEIKVLSRFSYETGFDSLKYNVLVSNEFFVKDFYNYPNPMNSETVFMFTIAGNLVIDCKIKIYTVSGKLIKTINSPVNIGFNQVRWDGRDEDGELIANGVYLYKLVVEGDGKKETPVQKLVVLK